MGTRSPHMTLTRKARHSNKNRPASRRGPSLPCATPTTTTPTRYHPPRPTPRSVHFRREIGPVQPGQPDVEARTTSSRAKATCRTSAPPANSRSAAAQPISARVTTDLDAEPDRSRGGGRPFHFRREIDPVQPGQPDVEARTTSSGAKATCRTSAPSASSRSAAARPISRMGT